MPAAVAGALIGVLGLVGFAAWLAGGMNLDPPRKPLETAVDIALPAPFGKGAASLPARAGLAEPRGTPADAAPASAFAGRGDEAPWRRFAAPGPAAEETRPMVALIIDDMGVARAASRRAARLPAPVTLAYLPYARDVTAQAEAARAAGHELLVHLPLEPDDHGEDPGPMALLLGLGDDELRWRLAWNLARIEGYVGVNNHMGSRFTRDGAAMDMVISEFKERGLLFVDSFTTADSKGLELAREYGIPTDRRHVFIDNEQDEALIRAQLDKLETRARREGYAIGIAHPRPLTLDVIETWVTELDERGILLVPVSAAIARHNGHAPIPRDNANPAGE